MSEPVLYEQDTGVVTLTLNRPETRNALTEMEVVDALVGSLERAQGDMSVRAIVLTGAGPSFSSGGNIKHMRDDVGTFSGGSSHIRENYRRGIQRIPKAFHELDVPCIAAVNGPAHGAGCDLALMCDIRIAAESALFAETFAKVGIIPGDGGAWLLPRAVGLSRACEMIFTGAPIDARCAHEWGLVSRVVPDAELLTTAQALARSIANNPPGVLRMSKRLIREGQRMDLPSLLELSAAF
jgi:enoyl-CoA hydratase/carnithine racemase